MEKATFEQYLELGQMIKRGELTKPFVQAVIEGRVEVKPKCKRPSITSFDPIPVDYSIQPDPIDGVDEDDQEYVVWDRDESCVDVPTEGVHDVIFQLVRFNMDMEDAEEVHAVLESLGSRSATFEEAYAFDERMCPDEFKGLMIIALGSIAWPGDYPEVTCLSSDGLVWHLGTDMIKRGWKHKTCCFLAVPKTSKIAD